jgi:enolase
MRMKMQIRKINALQILDSRGNPTIKAYITIGEATGSFSVPSGASTGVHEALELRDGGKEFRGLGVKKALKNIELIAKEIEGKEFIGQKDFDKFLIDLDGTENKSKLGANAILALSGAFARAAAEYNGVALYEYIAAIYENNGVYKKGKRKYILPELFLNIINGGKHAENNIDFQETMIVPKAKTAAERVRIAAEVYGALKEVLKSKKLATGLGDEGGFAPNLESNTKALELILEATANAGYRPGKDVALALDVASSSFYEPEKDNKYILNGENIALSAQQMTSFYRELISNYPIVSIEDGLAEDDWENWSLMTEKIGKQVELVGDDLFVTNIARIERGVKARAGNAVLVKMNQIGTVWETLEAIKLAKNSKFKTMISHRSGETDDSFIADLAVGTSAGQIKAGAPARGERTAKYNRLVEIEKEIKGE